MGHQDLKADGTGAMPEGMMTAALAKIPLALVVTNPHLEDNPIVYANQAFEQMSRYTAGAAIGRNCRFLQGEDTDPAQVRRIAEAIRNEDDVSVDILNYRADGTKFLNRLSITPLYDPEGNLQCFLGVQRDMSGGEDTDRALGDTVDDRKLDAALGEIQHRVKNHLAMIIGMIRMQARARTSEESFHALARRIESLQLLYQEMTEAGIGSSQTRNIPLGAYVSRIASTIGHLDGRRSVRVNVDCDAVEVNVEKAARIGLLFSELLTNALKHAFEGREEGLVEARLKMLSSGVIRMTVTDDGVGLPEGSHWPHPPQPGRRDSETFRRVTEEAEQAQQKEARHNNAARQIADSLRDSGAAAPTIVEESGEPSPPPEPPAGLGGRITLSLVRGLDARIDVNSDTVGTTVTIDIPPDE